MSDHSLPDDPTRWPSDPYRLLGVAHGINERDLKRAYLQLIRKYKPEHAPAEFQRIRQAYETVQQFIKIGLRWNTFSSDQENDDETLVETRIESGRETKASPAFGDDFLEPASADQAKEAYRRLRGEFEASSAKYDLHLKLYWRLVASPELDPGRKPIDWLFRGLAARQGRCHASFELIRRAIQANATVVFGDLPQELMGTAMDPAFISQFVGLRWRAARRLGFWNVIRADLTNLRPRSQRDLEVFWPGIVSTAAVQMVWSNEHDFATVRALMREIESWGLGYKQIDATLYELDCMIELAESRQALGTGYELSSVVSQVLPMMGDPSGGNFGWIVHPLIEALARDLSETLLFFDRLIRFQPAIFAQLVRLIDGILPENAEVRPDIRGPDVVRLPIRLFVNGTNWSAYASRRPALLRFCLQEAIDPERFAEHVCDPNQFSQKVNEKLGPFVVNDWSLRYTYRAWAVARKSWCLRRLPT